jgi:hypothetical protein
MDPVTADAAQFLTSDEVIEILHRDPLLRRIALSCVLPSTKVGDAWMFRRADLDAWIERQRQEAARGGGRGSRIPDP